MAAPPAPRHYAEFEVISTRSGELAIGVALGSEPKPASKRHGGSTFTATSQAWAWRVASGHWATGDRSHPPRARRPRILVRVQTVRPTMGFYHSFRGPRTHRRILHPEHRLEPICGGRPRGTRGPAGQGWQREARGGAVVSMYSRVLDCHSARPEYGVLFCGRS